MDPDVAKTGEPYLYAVDDPVNETDPSGDASWQSAGPNPPSCSGTFTVVYDNFTRKLEDGGTGNATLYCGNSDFGLLHILAHYHQFVNGWGKYGGNWSDFVKFMAYDLAHWSLYSNRTSNDTSKYVTGNVGFYNTNTGESVDLSFGVIVDRDSGRIVTAVASSASPASLLGSNIS